MKKYLIFLMTAGLLLASCELEHSDNGDLDGLWLLSSVDTLATGGTADVRQQQVTWAVQGTILEMRVATSHDVMQDIVFDFNHTSDSLLLHNPYISDRDNGDVRVDDVALLRIFGLSRLEEGFKVMQLSDENMQLQSKTLRLYFRKY